MTDHESSSIGNSLVLDQRETCFPCFSNDVCCNNNPETTQWSTSTCPCSKIAQHVQIQPCYITLIGIEIQPVAVDLDFANEACWCQLSRLLRFIDPVLAGLLMLGQGKAAFEFQFIPRLFTKTPPTLFNHTSASVSIISTRSRDWSVASSGGKNRRRCCFRGSSSLAHRYRHLPH